MNNKKASKGVVSAALAFALALAFLPAAHAATTPAVDADGTVVNANGGTADSTVKVLGGENQMRVTVPLGFSVAANIAGGAFQTVPHTYAIKNGSLFPVQVTSIAVTPLSGWEYSASDLHGADAPTDPANIGVIGLKLTPEGGAQAVLDSASTLDTSAEAGWTIAGKTGAKDVSKKIAIDGSTSKLMKMIDDNAASDAVKITYTIAPADAPSA